MGRKLLILALGCTVVTSAFLISPILLRHSVVLSINDVRDFLNDRGFKLGITGLYHCGSGYGEVLTDSKTGYSITIDNCAPNSGHVLDLRRGRINSSTDAARGDLFVLRVQSAFEALPGGP